MMHRCFLKGMHRRWLDLELEPHAHPTGLARQCRTMQLRVANLALPEPCHFLIIKATFWSEAWPHLTCHSSEHFTINEDRHGWMVNPAVVDFSSSGL